MIGKRSPDAIDHRLFRFHVGIGNQVERFLASHRDAVAKVAGHDLAAQAGRVLSDFEFARHIAHGSSRIRSSRNSTGEPSDSRHRYPVAGWQFVPPETSSPLTQSR